MLVRLLCVIFVVSSFLSCTRRDETAKIIKLELISSKIKNISLPNDIVNFDARASHYYFYTKDSVFIYDTQLNLVVKFGFKRLENIINGSSKFSYLGDSLCLNAKPYNTVFGDHNEMFSLVDFRNFQFERFVFNGLPVRIGKLFSSKSKSLKSFTEATHAVTDNKWNYRLNRKDTSLIFPLLLFDEEEKLVVNNPANKYVFVKLGVNGKVNLIDVPLYPKLSVRSNFPEFNIFEIYNAWLNDSTMLYGFPTTSTHYIFHTNNNKFEEVASHYDPVPDEIKTDTASKHHLNHFNSYFDLFIVNHGGDGYLRIMRMNGDNSNSCKSLLFWHKNNGQTYKIDSSSFKGGIDYIRNDTFFSYEQVNVKSQQMFDLIERKYVVQASKE